MTPNPNGFQRCWASRKTTQLLKTISFEENSFFIGFSPICINCVFLHPITSNNNIFSAKRVQFFSHKSYHVCRSSKHFPSPRSIHNICILYLFWTVYVQSFHHLCFKKIYKYVLNYCSKAYGEFISWYTIFLGVFLK